MNRYSEIPTTRQALEEVLHAIVLGKIGVPGVNRFMLPSDLDGVVLNLDGPPDGSVIIGTRVNCGKGVSAEVEMVGNKVYDGHIIYTIRFQYIG